MLGQLGHLYMYISLFSQQVSNLGVYTKFKPGTWDEKV
jgi:hypothetical protein